MSPSRHDAELRAHEQRLALQQLSTDRLPGEADERRLPALHLDNKVQDEITTQLAEQVLGALIELLRGFQAADEAAGGELLRDCAGDDSKHVYDGLLTVLLRLVFLLYAEDRGLLPDSPTWADNDSVVGLFERLREDAERYPDTMDQRYGAWARLLTLFRGHPPARQGLLFDRNEYPFLEGRVRAEDLGPGERLEPPRVSDGTLVRVLQGLLVLDGERLSYRSLDVEQIGSIYESMIGYEVERAVDASIGLGRKHIVVNLAELLGQEAAGRKKWLEKHAEVSVSGRALDRLEAAQTPEDVVVALQRRISKRTPTILPAGSLYLQPGEERRRTGSHYTPRALTEPIVRTTLRPVLEDLVTDSGGTPTEAQLLSLKVCDPAMGSGAFLVEACRQLAKQLVRAWDVHGSTRALPADEDALLHARRLVAQHCLYGVDKNPFAVNLAKLSLWLATMAKAHPLTFLDHALKCGDSLVGLTRKQITAFGWHEEVADDEPPAAWIGERMWNQEAEGALENARLRGDSVIAAFFAEGKPKAREQRRVQLWERVQRWHGGDMGARAEVVEMVRQLREDQGVVPFHWEIEFPEVFGSGFDLITGNPPFLGGKRISTSLGDKYKAWLRSANVETSSNTDLSAHFFRRAFGQLAEAGTIGFVATNTIAQGDTREGGLMYIAQHGGTIYRAQTRLRWPGLAAVVVSVVWIRKNAAVTQKALDGHPVDRISAYLMSSGPDESPLTLAQNAGLSYIGCDIKGEGFTFENNNARATNLSTMHQLVENDARNAERIFPYVGGAEINDNPASRRIRYVINFGSMSLEEASSWPDLLAIAAEKVKPERANRPGAVKHCPWWQFWRPRPALFAALARLEKVLASSQIAKYRCFEFLPARTTFSHKAVVIVCEKYGMFALLQCRCHESWSLFSGSSLKDDPVYTPSDCFETFPFPEGWQQNKLLEHAGQTYHDYRAALMIRNEEGLTTIYNRFHDPEVDDLELRELRELHAAMDRCVLEAYGWRDLAERATCEFRLEYEEPERDENSPRQRKKKKPWRYKWAQEFHDEVLARLLEVNQSYAEAESLRLGHDEPV